MLDGNWGLMMDLEDGHWNSVIKRLNPIRVGTLVLFGCENLILIKKNDTWYFLGPYYHRIYNITITKTPLSVYPSVCLSPDRRD